MKWLRQFLISMMCPIALSSTSEADAAPKKASIFDFEVMDIDGNKVKMSQFKGKAFMIVNTASKCGYTSQYEGLEQLYDQYKAKGFTILAFPSNDFLWQEPGSDEEIKEFCTLNYNTSFNLFSKVKVKGKGKVPLYDYLTRKANLELAGEVTWNFEKFLVDKKGNLVARFSPKTQPLDSTVVEAVEKVLK